MRRWQTRVGCGNRATSGPVRRSSRFHRCWRHAEPSKSSGATAYRGDPSAADLISEARDAALGLIPRGTSEMPALVAELLDSAFASDDLDTASTILDAIASLKPAQLLPLLDAEATRGRARLAAHHGDRDAADQHFRRAIGLFREL